MKEEEGHIDFGVSKTAELAAKGGESKEKVQKSLDFWYVTALDMFGRSESKRSERFLHWGLKRRSNAEAREQYIKEVKPIIENMGLTVPEADKGRQYT